MNGNYNNNDNNNNNRDEKVSDAETSTPTEVEQLRKEVLDFQQYVCSRFNALADEVKSRLYSDSDSESSVSVIEQSITQSPKGHVQKLCPKV